MFARKFRISKQKEIDNIFKKGKTINNGFFKIVFLNNGLMYNRYTIVINKKVSKSAFFRNSIKRKFRNSFKKYFIEEKRVDIIVIVFPNVKENINLIDNEIQKIYRKFSTS